MSAHRIMSSQSPMSFGQWSELQCNRGHWTSDIRETFVHCPVGPMWDNGTDRGLIIECTAQNFFYIWMGSYRKLCRFYRVCVHFAFCLIEWTRGCFLLYMQLYSLYHGNNLQRTKKIGISNRSFIRERNLSRHYLFMLKCISAGVTIKIKGE